MSMKVGIIGGGIEGWAAARYWQQLGADVTIRDQNPTVAVSANVALKTGSDYLKGLDEYDLLVRSPSVRPDSIHAETPVTSVTKEFFARCPARIIGVTGTKGKGTTASLIKRILEEAGRRVWLGGTTGIPPLDFLKKIKASDVVVLELSSLQLMDLDVSPHVAVCLMVVPERMDWHRSMREYAAAQGNLFWHQQLGDVAIYNFTNDFSTQIALLSPGRKLPYMQYPGAVVAGGWITLNGEHICAVGEAGLLGAHNLENICAAIMAAREIIGDNMAAMKRAIIDFRGLPHRLEFVGAMGHVRYFDDSFSTTPETTIAAIGAFNESKVLILGGLDKNSSYGEMARAVRKGNVRRVVLMGAAAFLIARALREAGYDEFETGRNSMKQIVDQAEGLAQPGDVVLLSPGCASDDGFKDDSDRGEQFGATIRRLKQVQV